MSANARHIRLQLAREPGHAEGDPHTGYDIVAFLDAEGHLDLEACRDHASVCRVRRFRQDTTIATGQLHHGVGDRWTFDFPQAGEEDATGFRLGDERFIPGEYVSVIARNGTAHTYRVERVAEVPIS